MKVSHLLALLLFAAASTTGCVNAPYGMSLDRHNFGSTTQQPKHVALVDATNGETVWSIDVPVGQTLVVDLKRDAWWTQSEQTGGEPAHSMQWDLFETGDVFGTLQEEVKLSGNPVYLQVAVRDEEEPAIEDATYTPVDEPPLPEGEPEPVPAEPEEAAPAEGEDEAPAPEGEDNS